MATASPDTRREDREHRDSLPPVLTESTNYYPDSTHAQLVVPLNDYQSTSITLNRTQAAQAITALATWLATTPQEEQ